MLDERVQAAKRAELKEFLHEHATNRDWLELAASGCAYSGLTLSQLYDPDAGPLEFDPKVQAAVVARIQLRLKFDLGDVGCIDPKPPSDSGCGCIDDALDELGENATRARVLRKARATHKARNGPFQLLPQYRHLLPKRKPETNLPPRPKPKPKPVPAEVVTQTSTKKNFRVVKRRPKWWDPPSGSGGIQDMKF